MLFETCAREELNKLELYVHAAGGKHFKFEDNPSFFSMSGCSTTVHLLDHRHFHVLGVVVVGQIKVIEKFWSNSPLCCQFRRSNAPPV